MSLMGTSDLIYTFSRADVEVKAKFKDSISKVRDWRSYSLVVKKYPLTNAIKDKTLAPWGFTTHWGKVPINCSKMY